MRREVLYRYGCSVIIAVVMVQSVFAQEEHSAANRNPEDVASRDAAAVTVDDMRTAEVQAQGDHAAPDESDSAVSKEASATTVDNGVGVDGAQDVAASTVEAGNVSGNAQDAARSKDVISGDGAQMTAVQTAAVDAVDDSGDDSDGSANNQSEKLTGVSLDKESLAPIAAQGSSAGNGVAKNTTESAVHDDGNDVSEKSHSDVVTEGSVLNNDATEPSAVQSDDAAQDDDDALGDACLSYSDQVRLAFVSIGDALSSRNDIVALRNDDDTCVSLKHYKLRKLYSGTHNGVSVVKNVSVASSFAQNDTIAPGALFYWAYKKSRFAKQASVVNTKTLSDDTALALIFDDGNRAEVMDTIAWGGAPTDGSVLQDGLVLNDRVRNPTKREYIARSGSRVHIAQQCAHALLRTDPCVQPYSGQRIVINEVLPNPSGDEHAGEYIELFNPGTEIVNLHGWTIGDASSSGRYRFPLGVEISPHGYYVVKRQIFGFALNNSHESVVLWAPGNGGDVVVDQLRYERSAPEDVSLNRTDHGAYRWSKYRTPGAQNIFNNLPTITSLTIDQKIFRDVAARFSVRAEDGDGEALSYRWDFGDGHRSYKRVTTHTYTQTGRYTVSLRVGDGSEEVVRTMSIDVRKYPRTKNVKITTIAPNPEGKDAGTEYLIVENAGKKKIALRGWSIATGRDKEHIVNHPIREKIRLRAGKEKRITARYAAITLPNKGGVVELRRPDGGIAQRVTYRTPKGHMSIPSDAIYRKQSKRDGGGWAWDVPQKAQNVSQKKRVAKQDADLVKRIIAQAWRNEFAQQQLAPAVRGAAVARISDYSAPWYGALGSAVNARITSIVETVLRAVHRGVRSDDVPHDAVIDRAAVADITGIHPAVVALSLTGLLPQSPVELAQSDNNQSLKQLVK